MLLVERRLIELATAISAFRQLLQRYLAGKSAAAELARPRRAKSPWLTRGEAGAPAEVTQIAAFNDHALE
jgi:hypothetical protein